MAQLLDDNQTSNLTEETISQSLENSVSTYSEYFEKAPVLATYYSIDWKGSRRDVSLGNFEEAVGADSPLRFSKIENLPLYSLEGFDLGVETGEFGAEGTIEGTAVIPPRMVTPRVDDCFKIAHDGVSALYKVQDVQKSHIHGPAFHQITFFLYQTDDVDIEEQVDEELEVVCDGTRPEKTAVISKNNALALSTAQMVINSLQDYFIKTYYQKNVEDFAINTFKNERDSLLADTHLRNFIVDHRVFARAKPYRNEVFLYNRSSSLLRDEMHPLSFLSECRTPKAGEILPNAVFYEENNNLDGGNLYKLFPTVVYTSFFTKDAEGEDLFSFLESEVAPDNQLQELVWAFLRGEYEPEVWQEKLKSISVNRYQSVAEYYYIPCLIYLLKEEQKKLTTN